jgi:hypothetical protein
MAEREIKRNGRGQIVSYEIYGALDSTIQSDSYGKSSFITTGQSGTKVVKLDQSSFVQEFDITISDELRVADNNVNPLVSLQTIINVTQALEDSGFGQ